MRWALVDAHIYSRMRRGAPPHAAGRTTPGIPPTLAPIPAPSINSAVSHVKAGLQRALTGQDLKVLRAGNLSLPISPEVPHGQPRPEQTFSNRNFQRLENAVTSTKQTPGPKSNRNFRGTNFHPAGHWLTNVVAITDDLVPSTTLHSHTAANRPRTACAAGYFTNKTAISNRQWKGLEIAVTHSKQRPAKFLIDNKNSLLGLLKVFCFPVAFVTGRTS